MVFCAAKAGGFRLQKFFLQRFSSDPRSGPWTPPRPRPGDACGREIDRLHWHWTGPLASKNIIITDKKKVGARPPPTGCRDGDDVELLGGRGALPPPPPPPRRPPGPAAPRALRIARPAHCAPPARLPGRRRHLGRGTLQGASAGRAGRGALAGRWWGEGRPPGSFSRPPFLSAPFTPGIPPGTTSQRELEAKPGDRHRLCEEADVVPRRLPRLAAARPARPPPPLFPPPPPPRETPRPAGDSADRRGPLADRRARSRRARRSRWSRRQTRRTT